jgi:nucleoside 2-deoxyribosyltransferase
MRRTTNSRDARKQCGGTAQKNVTPPAAIRQSLARFYRDYPTPNTAVFIMMRFGETPAHEEIVQSIKGSLQPYGFIGVRADEKEYHADLYYNILTYVFGCGFGVAVFERLLGDEFNPNVAFEVGFMTALQKHVCLLKDKTIKALHTDLIGKLYRPFDPQDAGGTVPGQLTRWLRDKGLIVTDAQEDRAHDAFYSDAAYWDKFHILSTKSLEEIFQTLLCEATFAAFLRSCVPGEAQYKAFIVGFASSRWERECIEKANKVRSLAGLDTYKPLNPAGA